MKPATAEQINLPQTGAIVLQREARDVAVSDPESIVRFAVEHKADAATMASVMAVRRELRAEAAKEAYDRAMAAFQAECPIIQKRKAGAKGAYKYAPLDDIVSQVKELVMKHGFSFSITSDIEPGWVKAVCKITHSGGHFELSQFKVPVDSKNTMMTDPQRYGGSMTFAKRYALCNGFGILTADEDLDGGDRPKPPGPSSLAAEPTVKEYAAKLWTLLAPVRGTEKNWNAANQWLWKNDILDGAVPESAPNLTVKRFKEVIAAAETKLAN